MSRTVKTFGPRVTTWDWFPGEGGPATRTKAWYAPDNDPLLHKNNRPKFARIARRRQKKECWSYDEKRTRTSRAAGRNERAFRSDLNLD
jgi:hypothetical protein